MLTTGEHAQKPESMWDISHSKHESGRDNRWDPLLTEELLAGQEIILFKFCFILIWFDLI